MFNWRRRREPDFTQEIEAHLALEVDRLRGEGMSAEEAQATARREFGNVLRAQEQFRESGRWMWLDHLLRDIKFALRMLLRNPGFTTVAVLSLALGIGVNALVFSVANAVVLRPLPVRDPSQLVFLEGSHHNPGQSFPNYREVRDHNEVFSGLLGYRMVQVEMESDSAPVRTWGYLATGNYFDVLGVKPFLGRFFHEEDDLHPGASPYTVLSYGSWKSRFAGDPAIVGKTIRINRQPYTVLGVAPRSFQGTEIFYWPEMWVPMMMQAQIEPGNPWLEGRASFNTWSIGRLKPGVSIAAATANLNLIAADLARAYPGANRGLKFQLARPGLVGDNRGPLQAGLLGVLVLAGLVLLTACANLVSMITARAKDRQREIAIRLSIGASKGRIVRQVLTETVLLGFIGGAAGYMISALLAKWLSSWHAPLDFPVQFDVTPDWRVFAFATAISLVSGILFGLAPARRAARADANAILKGESSALRGRQLAWRDFLVVGQVALCFVLVCASLLSIDSLRKSLAIHLGMEPARVTVTGFDLGLAGYDEEKGRQFEQRALRTVENLPGVQSAAYSNSLPLSIDENRTGIVPEHGGNLSASEAKYAFRYQISPGFFNTLGIRLDAGRDFTWHDDRNAPPVAIVNWALAKQILHTDKPLGKRFHAIGPSLWEVVGVAEDGKYESPGEASTPALFIPFLQSYNTTHTLIVRSSLPEQEMAAKIHDALRTLDPSLPLYGTGSLTQLLGFAFFPARAAALALNVFGMLAIVLAATGIYGLISYAVAQRTHEIGIRVAIGATPAQVVRLVMGRTGKLVAAGSAIGIALALASGKVLSAILYQASPGQPGLICAVLFIVVLLGILSSWAPTLRALRIDPASALRRD